MSFYRIYRPKVFSEIDNSSVRETLQSLLTKKKDELPHAFLFSGPHGTGKTTSARLVAKLFNCEKPDTSGAPCGRCDACISIGLGNHMDVLEIDAASHTGVDNIRDLREKIKLSPMTALWKVYIIDEVHMLSTGAFNALLKTLEEPPKHAVFVLATTDPHKIPSTIISRCVHITFTRPSEEEVVTALRRIATAEKIDLTDDVLREISQYASGSFRDAVKLLEQASLAGEKITMKNISSLLHMSDDALVTSFVKALEKHDVKEAFAIIAMIESEGADIESFHSSVLHKLQGVLTAHALGEDAEYSLPFADARLLIRLITRSYDELKITPIPTLPLELAVVEYCRREDDTVSEKKEEVRPPQEQKKSRPSAPNRAVSPPPRKKHEEPTSPKKAIETEEEHDTETQNSVAGLVTVEKLTNHWNDVIAELKPYNHSISGLLRSTRPRDVIEGKLTIEAFYEFHFEKLSTAPTKQAISAVIKKLFGETVSIEVVKGSK